MVIAAIVLASGFFQVPSVKAEGFRISGAGLFGGLVTKFSDVFATTSPNCKVTIIGATTGKGFKKFIAGQAEMVMASRKMTDKEMAEALSKGIEPKSELVGRVSLAVMVNAANPVRTLTMEQLGRIFRGEITSWSEVGGQNAP